MSYKITEIHRNEENRNIVIIDIESGDTIVFQPFGDDIIGTTTPQWLYKSNPLYRDIRKAIWWNRELDEFIGKTFVI